MGESRKVAIVNAGGDKSLSAESESYDSLVASLERGFERRQREGKPLLETQVVHSTEEALKWVGINGTIFYVTNGMADEAERVRREHGGICVVVLTGAPIDGVI